MAEDFGAVLDGSLVEVRNAELVLERMGGEENWRAELVVGTLEDGGGEEDLRAELVVGALADVGGELGVEAFGVDVGGVPLVAGTLEGLAGTMAKVEGLPLLEGTLLEGMLLEGALLERTLLGNTLAGLVDDGAIAEEELLMPEVVNEVVAELELEDPEFVFW